jgi:hypothetical protein
MSELRGLEEDDDDLLDDEAPSPAMSLPLL